MVVFLAWFWFGGVSMAQECTKLDWNDISEETNISSAVASIWSQCFTTLTWALNAEWENNEIKLLSDINVSDVIKIKKSLTIDGWDFQYSINTTAARWIRVETSNAAVTIKNIKLIWDGVNTQRWIQVNLDLSNVTLNLENVKIEWVTYYSINICWGVENLILNIKDSDIAWWWAVNLWWKNWTVNIEDSVLEWINDKSYNADWWNNFGTVILEWDTTNQTTEHSEAYNVTIKNSIIKARQTTWNKQFAIIFNNPSADNNVIIDWESIISYEWNLFAYIDWSANKLIVKNWTFSWDVSWYTIEWKCSIKNSEWTYDVRDCPESINFAMSTNKDVVFPLVLRDDWTINLNETVAVLKKTDLPVVWLYAWLVSDNATEVSLNTSAKVISNIDNVDWQKLLFFNDWSKIWVFTEVKEWWVFSSYDKFITNSNDYKEIASNPIDFVFNTWDKIVDPFNVYATNWIDEISWYNEIKNTEWDIIWYSLHYNEWNSWFYAPAMYTIKFVNEDGKTVSENKYNYWTLAADITPSTNPSKAADSSYTYTFNKWTPDVVNVTTWATYTATYNRTAKSSWGSSSGGGSSGWSSSSSSSSKTTTPTNNTWSNTTGANTTSNTEEINLGWKVSEESTTATEETSTPDNGYSKEFNDAYTWAFKNGITTMSPIEKADMNAPLTRIAMAKMLSQYAINVLGKAPDTTKVVPNFPDVSAELDAQYNSWVTLAYQLGIMWLNIDNFRPNDLVTRAEFGTALSRMLYGLADGEWAYYETHLAKLMEEKIITVDTPDLQELRGYVMIMLMRSANK